MMVPIRISSGDQNCRYLAAPESRTFETQFGQHLDALGIKLPSNLQIRILVKRGWIKPRLRVALPPNALLTWSTFPSYPASGIENCPESDRWALETWFAATCSSPNEDLPTPKLWMHWLDDPQDCTTPGARKNAVDTSGESAEPTGFTHPHHGPLVLPWIDFFADWQGYHIAELVRMSEFTVLGVTDQFGSCSAHAQHHTANFDKRAKDLAHRWEERGAFMDLVSCYRTILANCSTRDSFSTDARDGARSWAEQRGIRADAIRTGIRDVLLTQWRRWEDSPPSRGTKLMHRLQQDIQYATRLIWDLTDEPVDPFDPIWFSKDRQRREWAQLIDALPYEEWLARRDFAGNAVHYQKGFPHPYVHGEDQLAALLTRHWQACPPLRRFCLAWVRLHEEMRGRDRDLPADVTIEANERIEQFNLIGLHTERLLRHVGAAQAPATGTKQDGSNKVIREAAQRSLMHLPTPVAVPDARIDDLLKRHAALHTMPDLSQQLCTPTTVASGSEPADQLVAAHVNALIARNYAAHHDYLDDELIYPNRDEAKPHAGGTLMSSCLLVVIAALHSLAACKSTGAP